MTGFASKKLIIIITIALVALFLILVYQKLARGKSELISPPKETSVPSQVAQDSQPQIVSTKPDPLEGNIIKASEPIEITFNRPLQNVPEFRFRLEPKTDVKVELSSDKKTAKIIPLKPWFLGAGFTLYIQPETKFDGAGEWKQDKTYHFGTIKYTGV